MSLSRTAPVLRVALSLLSAFVLLVTASALQAQVLPPSFFHTPDEPRPIQSASISITIDVCGYQDVEWQGLFWNNAPIGATKTDPFTLPCFDSFRLQTGPLTAIPGDNLLRVEVSDAAFGQVTDVAHYYFGAWVTPRSPQTSSIRANATLAVFVDTVENTANTAQTYNFAVNCTGAFTSCSVDAADQGLIFAAGEKKTVRVRTNTAAAGQTGLLVLKPQVASTGGYADSAEVLLTTITPTMDVSPQSTTLSTYAGYQKTVTFQVQNPPQTVGVTYLPRCPQSWSCSVSGPTSVGPGAANVNLSFTPQTGIAQTLYLVAIDAGVFANRDSGGVTVAVNTPIVSVTTPSANVTLPALSNQTIPFTMGVPGGTPQDGFTYTVTCTPGLTCGSISPPSPQQLGSITANLPVTVPAFNSGTKSITVTVWETDDPGNRATTTVNVTPGTNVAFNPTSQTVNRPPNQPSTIALSIASQTASPYSYTVSIDSCGAPVTACSLTGQNPVTASSGNPASVTLNFMPGANQTSGTVVVRASDVSQGGNFALHTLTVQATALTVAAVPPVKSEYASAVDSATFSLTWGGASPLPVTFTVPTCSGVLSGCVSPGGVTVPANSQPITVTVPHSVGASGTGQLALNATGSGASGAGSMSVTAARTRVRVSRGQSADSIQFFTPSAAQPIVFYVVNDTTYATSYTLTRLTDGATVQACSGPSSVGPVSPFDSVTVTLTCQTALGANGWVQLTAKQSSTGGTGNTATGRWNKVTVGTYAVAVTPDNQAVTVPPGNQSQDFWVDNTGTLTAQLTFSTPCTGQITQCTSGSALTISPADPPQKVTVSYNSGAAGQSGGQVRLQAQVTGRPELDQGYVTVTTTAAANLIVADLAANNYDNHRTDLCEVSCFAVRTAVSTVPYYSLDQPRSVTLAYNSDAFAVRPIVHVDVRLSSAPATTLQEYWLEAKDSTGALITFVNGETKLRFAAPGNPTTTSVRLSGQFDATTYASGVFPVSLIVSAKYATPTATETTTIPTKFLVVNERKSSIAKGWSVAGLSRIKLQNNADALIVDGSGSAVFFVGCGTGCFMAPNGDFSKLSSSGSGGALTYKREFPDSSRAEYDNLGYLKRLISRTLDTVTFTYDGNGRLGQVTDPFRATTVNGPVRLYTAFAYGTHGLQSITEPGQVHAQAGGRQTTFQVQADSTLTLVTDPLSGTIGFGYDASKRLRAVRNRRGDSTHYRYDAVTWKMDSTLSDTFTVDARLGGGTARLKTAYRSWQTVSVPRGSTSGTMFTPVKTDSVFAFVIRVGSDSTRLSANRWGQAIQTIERFADALADTTVVTRAPNSILATTVRRPIGAIDSYVYNASGLPTQMTPAGERETNIFYTKFAQPDSIVGPGRPKQEFVLGPRGRVESVKLAGAITTAYGYDSRYRVTSTTDNAGNITRYYYEAVYGNNDSTRAPLNRKFRNWHDGYGRVWKMLDGFIPERVLQFDLLNRVMSVRNLANAPSGVKEDTTIYTYGDGLNLTQVTDVVGHVYSFKYNNIGVKTGDMSYVGAFAESTYVDALGRVSTWKNRRNDRVQFTYDKADRRLRKDVVVGGVTVYKDSLLYDPNNLWVEAHNAVTRDRMLSDATGWVSSVETRFATDNFTKVFTRSYARDTVGRLKDVQVSFGTSGIATTTRGYRFSQLTGALDSVGVNGQVSSFTYNNVLVPQTLTTPGNVTKQMSSTQAHDFFRFGYSGLTGIELPFWRATRYDSVGRMAESFAYTAGSSDDRTAIRYRTDMRRRLTATHDSTMLYTSPCEDQTIFGTRLCAGYTPLLQWKDSTAYNKQGEPTYVNGFSGVGSITLNAGNKLRASAYPGYSSLAYDNAGNLTTRTPTSGTATQFGWSAEGLLDSVKVGAQVRYYDYNVSGELVRIRQGATTSHLLWDQGHLLAELNGSLSARIGEYAYLSGVDQPHAFLDGATAVSSISYYQVDLQGNVLGLVSSTGTVVYAVGPTSPWGDYQTLDQGVQPAGSRLSWKGLMFDGGISGLYYVRARWYDPELRRFLTPDPIGLAGGIHPYAFGSNNPVDNSDPSGLLTNGPGEDDGCVYDYQTWRLVCTKGKSKRGSFTEADAWLVFMQLRATARTQRAMIEWFLPATFAAAALVELGGAAAARGALRSCGPARSTKLYRAVGLAEHADLAATGAVRAGPNSFATGKWFWEARNHAIEFGTKMDGAGNFRVIGATFPRSVSDQFMRMERLDGIGAARFGTFEQLADAVIDLCGS